MTVGVRFVRGRWQRKDDGIWEHIPELDVYNYTVQLGENETYQSIVAKIKDILGFANKDDIELTYQWPHWMLGPDWRKAEPIKLVVDDDAALFMAIHADLEEVFLRVRVSRGVVVRNVNSYQSNFTGGGQISRWMNGNTRDSGTVDLSSIRATLTGPPAYNYRVTTDSPTTSVLREGPTEKALGKRPVVDLNNDFTGANLVNRISKRISFNDASGSGFNNKNIAQNEYIIAMGQAAGDISRVSSDRNNRPGGGVRAMSSVFGAPVGVGGQCFPHNIGLSETSLVFNSGIGVRGNDYSSISIPIGNQSRVIGTEGLERERVMVRATVDEFGEAREMASNIYQLWRYFIGTVSDFESQRPVLPPYYGPPVGYGLGLKSASTTMVAGPRGLKTPSLGTAVTDDSLHPMLVGSYVGTSSGSDINPTQATFLGGASTDIGSTWLREMTSDENFYEDDLPDYDGDIHVERRISLAGYDMTPRRVTESIIRPVITTPPANIGRLDKGKGKINEGISRPPMVGSSSHNPVNLTEHIVSAVEVQVNTVMHESDAPPYFDDLVHEDPLQRAMCDIDYEGDEIFVGRLFKNKEDCKLKLAIHAINRKFHFKHQRTCPNVLTVVCVSDTCRWRVYSTRVEESERFEVRTISLKHTCSVDARGNFQRNASTSVIGDMMRARYGGVGRGSRACDLRRMIRQEFILNISYWKAWRAREIAMDNALGSAMGSYALIPPYFRLLLKTNPNSVIDVATEMDKTGVERFKYLFFSLAACAEGYKWMRKVIVVDSIHLQGRYGGCLVAASAQDGNFQIFPLAFAILDSENDNAWCWFMRHLSMIVPDEPDLVFVSDHHSSMYTSIRQVYPMSSNAACIVHLQRNIHSIFKSSNLSSMVSQAGRAYRLTDFDRLFAELREADSSCADYLDGIGFEHWTRSHFVGERYNVMSNNISESLNKVLTSVRDFPVISILETIRTTLVTWFALRRDASNMDDDNITPKVQEMIIESFEKATGYFVLKVGDGLYEVRDENYISFLVHLWDRTCTCREFQLLQIPCKHAVISAIREGIRVDSLVGVHYSIAYRKRGYEGIIMPVPDMDTLAPSPADIGGGKLAPPLVRRPPGRPRGKHFFSKGEFKRTNRRRCTRCRIQGHNKATCKNHIL